ncbi:MAG: hypothetical protein GXP37_11740 [Chloroflexi bacterium]|nr:hypothetical protein [Chloroflexota bacterium]
MLDYRSHLSVTVWAALLVLVLGAVLTLPDRAFVINVLGSPVRFAISSAGLVGLVAVTVVCAGFEAALQTHPRKDLLRHTYRYWGLPGATVMTATLTLAQLTNKGLWLLGLGVTAVILITVLWAEYHVLDVDASDYRRWRLVLNAVAFVLVAVALISIYQGRTRSLVSAPLVGSITMLVALDLLRETTASIRVAHLYASVIAFLMAQATWLLNYAAFSAVRVGLVMLVVFYLLVSWTQLELHGRYHLRRGLEYLVLAGGMVLVIVAIL